jgi:hypothetical protein
MQINMKSFFKKIFARDKFFHAFFGMFIYMCCMGIGMPDYLSLLTVSLVAIGKEYYDSRNQDKHTPEYLDIYATVLPALILYLIYLK